MGAKSGFARMSGGVKEFVNAHSDERRGNLRRNGGILRLILRFFQFILGLAIVGLYGTDLNKARLEGKYMDSWWTFALSVGIASAVFALTCMVPHRRVNDWYLRILDGLMVVPSWVLFAKFTALYGNEDPESVGHGKGTGPAIQRMKNAIWVDLINALLWSTTCAWGVVVVVMNRQRRQ